MPALSDMRLWRQLSFRVHGQCLYQCHRGGLGLIGAFTGFHGYWMGTIRFRNKHDSRLLQRIGVLLVDGNTKAIREVAARLTR